jgi:hypothetical protein
VRDLIRATDLCGPEGDTIRTYQRVSYDRQCRAWSGVKPSMTCANDGLNLEGEAWPEGSFAQGSCETVVLEGKREDEKTAAFDPLERPESAVGLVPRE